MSRLKSLQKDGEWNSLECKLVIKNRMKTRINKWVSMNKLRILYCFQSVIFFRMSLSESEQFSIMKLQQPLSVVLRKIRSSKRKMSLKVKKSKEWCVSKFTKFKTINLVKRKYLAFKKILEAKYSTKWLYLHVRLKNNKEKLLNRQNFA